MKYALKQAKEALKDNPDVTSVGIGFRYKNGKRTSETCIVVGVKEKLKREHVPKARLVPLQVGEVPTDVQERRIIAYEFKVKPEALVQKMRPCPPGFSIGHTAITAGTLGAYVKRGVSEEYVILSNNHVLAASNDGKYNDIIIQPGKADGGFSGTDHFAWLDEYARIRWDGEGNGNGCNLFKRIKEWFKPSRVIEQPYPNLIDAAIARPVNPGYVKTDYPFDLGELAGIRDLRLGDRVQKAGRTTEYTVGTVEGVSVLVKVGYGPGKVATYDDQYEIRADVGEFSAPGDSGSAILTMDMHLGGLFFAGGSGVTIANRISNVVALLGIRL